MRWLGLENIASQLALPRERLFIQFSVKRHPSLAYSDCSHGRTQPAELLYPLVWAITSAGILPIAVLLAC